LLDTVGLADWGKTNVTKYSKGMLQRLGLAQAMLHKPDVLVLDEPTDGVDPVGRSEIRDVLNQLKSQGKTIFLNSHLLQEIELVCDQVAILFRGEVLKIGPVAEVTNLAGDSETADVTLELDGDTQAITDLLPDDNSTREQIGETRWKVTLAGTNQDDIDRLIDAARERQLSVVSISRQKLTLEEAFLRLVRGAAGDDS
jgi:ABC-2 type transport system ATP-binding protein